MKPFRSLREYENEIREKGLTAARVTPERIESRIVEQQFYQFPETTLTVCALTLKNGHIVVGESACVHPENFDAELGCKIARDRAMNKIWELEGYLLRETMAQI